MYQVRSLADPDPLSGAFWGFLFGVAFLLPLAGEVEPAGLTRIGLTDEFLHRIRAGIRPGTSALFLLLPTPAPDALREALAADAVIETNFPPHEAEDLHRAFAQLPA